MDLLAELQKIESLQNVPVEQLEWLLDKGNCLIVKKGEYLFQPGRPIDRMLIVLKGHIVLKVERDGQFQTVGKFAENSISGLLPYSRATTGRGYGEAIVETHILALDQSWFKEMIRECHELTTVLVHTMSTRIRTFTKQVQQNDKMISLGKLSAGLAHELNNPSSAVVRSAQELSRQLKTRPEAFKNIIKVDLSDEAVDHVNGILFSKVAEGVKDIPLIEKSSIEDELLDWMDEHEIEESDEYASTFVDYGFTADDLDDLLDQVGKQYLVMVLGWINQVLSTEKIVSEIEDASQRIHDLVTSIKGYTHMDQAPEKAPEDIHKGLNSTLVMLNHKLKKIEVIKEFDESIPLPEVLAGPMNQVWTNLIDNAIDAMDNQPKQVLRIRTYQEGNNVNVDIEDSGTGIPEEVQDNIFDPFFTTKAVGKGTGIGLEFVQNIVKAQHNGQIFLKSKPGQTIFTISIPIQAE